MANLSCPNYSTLTKRGGIKIWVIVVAVLFFPIGLLALFAGRKPTQCNSCNHTWQA